ncbi:MAG: protein-disulfide reductase DsbD N-terminal domain-containing protein [Bacteroidales bacterium]|nr:protein-disulfide reductase DsbD N-terminal domain-containing protein [Bacteroidales bacterium]
MRNKLILILAFIAIAFNGFSQKNNALNWKFYAENQDNGNVNLIFETTIKDGFHLYSPYNPQGASRPLEININDTQNFTKIDKIKEAYTPQEKYEEFFEVTEKFFVQKAKFTIEITPKNSDKQTVTGTISGQVCKEDGFCSMVEENFSIEINPISQKKKIK